MAARGLARPLVAIAQALDRRYGWDRLPLPLGLVTLLGLRHRLQADNLYGTGVPNGVQPGPWDTRYRTARTLDGTYNDTEQPLMGSVGSRFGRNVPLERTQPEQPPRLLEPNPRRVSLELMTRDRFIPATTLNLLAAAWIQFEVHDWVFHGIPPDDDPLELTLGEDDRWPDRPMRVNRTRPDPNRDPNGGAAPTWASTETHWWDGSQVYGLDEASAARLRTGELGKLRIDERGLQPPELDEGLDYRGVPGSLWIGLAILNSLFVREHNAICDHLHAHHPELSDDELFDKARLVVTALMAKIHTVEWTPAIIAHPTTVFAMNAQWRGIVGQLFRGRFQPRTRSALVGGLPGSPKQLHGVPYSLTEEFVAVYRMHPLIPDELTFRSAATDDVLQERTFQEVAVLEMRKRLEELEMGDVFYSLGVSHPGAISLHNYPRALQEFHRADGALLDLAAIDVLRMRERGVPRYNDFRRLLHKPPVTSFEQLSSNPKWVEEIRRVYSGDLESVDLVVGLFAEPAPEGFGFSDTAFRIFILMATRRLESDRFFTDDYRPEVYTQAGLDWIDRNSMRSMLLRHFPELEPALRGVANAFAPWRRTA
jgi:hypothetical protein